ncbi:MAG: MFS transporter [Actinomycetota bacterium]|nr:MFS transporter [Actinomycetota bacterium]
MAAPLPAPLPTGRSILRGRLPPALGVSLGSFVVLGLCDGALGTAWPAIGHALHLPIGDLGLVQLAGTAGFLSASAVSGRVAARLGRASSLLLAAALGTASLGLFALTPLAAVLFFAALALGLAGGSIEPGVQSHVALSARARTMNLLHGCYGIGATLGPILVSGLLLAKSSWRLAYVVLASCEALVALGVLSRRRAFDATTPQVLTSRRRKGTVVAQERAYAPLALVLALSLFFIYTGLEVGTGQWAFSLLTTGRHLGTGLAGLLVAGYWGALTVVRLLVAAIGDHLDSEHLLTASAAGSVVGEALFWWNPNVVVGAIGLLLVGGSCAPAFPLMMSRTPHWVAAPNVSAVIGWQSASASFGIAALSGLAGILVGSLGLDVLGPYLLSMSAAFLALQLGALGALERRRAGGPDSVA